MSDKTKYVSYGGSLAIRKGQAINLAVASAAAQGRVNDTKFIAIEFLRFFHLTEMLQNYSIEQISVAIENPEVIEAIKKLDETLKNV